MAKKTGVVPGDDNIKFNEKKSRPPELLPDTSDEIKLPQLNPETIRDALAQTTYKGENKGTHTPMQIEIQRVLSHFVPFPASLYGRNGKHAIPYIEDAMAECVDLENLSLIAQLHDFKTTDSPLTRGDENLIYGSFAKGIGLGVYFIELHINDVDLYLEIGRHIPAQHLDSYAFPNIIKETYFQLKKTGKLSQIYEESEEKIGFSGKKSLASLEKKLHPHSTIRGGPNRIMGVESQ